MPVVPRCRSWCVGRAAVQLSPRADRAAVQVVVCRSCGGAAFASCRPRLVAVHVPWCERLPRMRTHRPRALNPTCPQLSNRARTDLDVLRRRTHHKVTRSALGRAKAVIIRLLRSLIAGKSQICDSGRALRRRTRCEDREPSMELVSSAGGEPGAGLWACGPARSRRSPGCGLAIPRGRAGAKVGLRYLRGRAWARVGLRYLRGRAWARVGLRYPRGRAGAQVVGLRFLRGRAGVRGVGAHSGGARAGVQAVELAGGTGQDVGLKADGWWFTRAPR